MDRRTFLGVAAGVTLSPTNARAASIPVIDTHIHLFDPTRPQGIPWPPKGSKIYEPALPARYRTIAAPLGVTGAIEIECSPWSEDNQWVLDVADKDSIMVGTIGNLEPGKPEFRKQLERFHKNRLFLGIRYGNLWGRNLGGELSNPEFVAGLKELAKAGLVLDSANPNAALIADLLRLTDLVPDLRIVVDHMPRLEAPEGEAARKSLEANLRELGQRPQVYAKLSGVLRRVDGRVPEDPEFYRPRLDHLCGIFGEDRVLYGSDWPNSDQWGTYPQGFKIVHDYFTRKGPAAAGKYFWKNSVAAYRWVKRVSGTAG